MCKTFLCQLPPLTWVKENLATAKPLKKSAARASLSGKIVGQRSPKWVAVIQYDAGRCLPVQPLYIYILASPKSHGCKLRVKSFLIIFYYFLSKGACGLYSRSSSQQLKITQIANTWSCQSICHSKAMPNAVPCACFFFFFISSLSRPRSLPGDGAFSDLVLCRYIHTYIAGVAHRYSNGFAHIITVQPCNSLPNANMHYVVPYRCITSIWRQYVQHILKSYLFALTQILFDRGNNGPVLHSDGRWYQQNQYFAHTITHALNFLGNHLKVDVTMHKKIYFEWK